MTLPNLGRLSLRAAAPTGVFAPILQPDDDAPKEQDALFKDELPWNEWWKTFCVKAATSGNEPVCHWYDARSLARYLHHAIQEGKTPFDPLNKQPLDRHDIDELLAIYPVDPGDPDWVQAGAVDNGARTEPQVKKALVALWRLRAAEAQRVVAGAAERLATLGAPDNDAPSIPTTAPTEPEPQPAAGLDWIADFRRTIVAEDVPGIRAGLDRGVYANTTVEGGKTAMHVAAKLNDALLVVLLMRSGFSNVNAYDANGNTPLHVAAIRNAGNAGEALLSAGADVELSNHSGKTPLHQAAAFGHLAMIELLIVEGRANVEGVNATNGFGPLHYAVEGGHPVSVKRLLEDYGAEPNAKSHSLSTPLHIACANPFPIPDVVRALLEGRADATLSDGYGNTPLHFMVLWINSDERTAVVEALLAADPPADPSARNAKGETPINLVRRHGPYDPVGQLLRVASSTVARARRPSDIPADSRRQRTS